MELPCKYRHIYLEELILSLCVIYRRKDCLRQFLVILCDRSELQTLVELPYKDRHVDLEEEVVSILEARARSIDLLKQTYYDPLYAFHVYRGNYRKGMCAYYWHVYRESYGKVMCTKPLRLPETDVLQLTVCVLVSIDVIHCYYMGPQRIQIMHECCKMQEYNLRQGVDV